MKPLYFFSKFLNAFFASNKTALIFFLIFGCICGAYFRNEREWWDFANYHYYNAWAFLNDRLNVDVVPAFVNTFFSPFIELPAYFLTNALNDHPVIFSAIMAVPYGLLLFASYKIATLFFSPETEQGRIRIGLTILLYIGSDAVLSQVSATTHEHFMSFMVIFALYPLLKGIKEHHLNINSCFLSGFILGAAAGLKMTYASYAAATGISLIVFYKRIDNPLKTIFLFTFAGFVGFMMSYGYWGWTLWKNFQSPVFPFFNSVFQSPYWEGADYKDMPYFNKSWLTILFFPVFLFWNINNEIPFLRHVNLSNFRVLFFFFFFLGTLFHIKKAGTNETDKKCREDKTTLYFLIFWNIVVYIIWLSFLRLYRYMIPFDLISSIILVSFIFKNKIVNVDRFFAFFFFIFVIAFLSISHDAYHQIKTYVLETGCLFFFMLFYYSFEKADKNAGKKCAVLLSILSVLITKDCMEELYRRIPDYPLLPFKSVSLDKDTLLISDCVPSSILVPVLAKDPTIRAIVNLKSTNIDKVNGSDFHKSGFFADKSRQLLKKHLKEKKPVAYITDIPKEEKDGNTPTAKADISNCLDLMTHDLYVSPRYHLCYDRLPAVSEKQ
ncbi:MAG: hypothetical protein IKR09_09535 [Alphaproteobacteria bacterium]|nr:hypothetical protein [Alphaproteobacteria bacterium]